MAIKCIKSEWCTENADYVREFVLDSADDVANLPKCCPGSTAIVATKGGAIYIVNASGEWVEI